MSQYENLEELLLKEKQAKPWYISNNYSDEDIYKLYRHNNPASRALWPNLDKSLDKGISGASSPDAMNGLASTFDYMITEDSLPMFKYAYNKSLTGLTEKLITGKERYNLDDYNPNVAEDVLSTVVSFMMPLDLLTFWTGGKFAQYPAGWLAKGLGYTAQKIGTIAGEDITLSAARVMAQKTLQKSGQRALLQGINQGTTLGVFEGAVGGVQAAINGEDILPSIVGGVIHGSILGGIAGFAGGGLMAKHAKRFGLTTKGQKILTGKLETEMKGKSAIQQGLLKAQYGIIGQLATESAIFTAPTVYELSKTDQLTVGNVMTEYAKNIGLFGILKAKHRVWEQGSKFLDDHYSLSGKPKDHNLGDTVFKNVKDKLEETSSSTIENKEVTQKNIDRIESERSLLFDKANIKEKDYNDLKADIAWLRAGLDKGSLSYENIKDVKRAIQTIIKLKGLASEIDVTNKENKEFKLPLKIELDKFEGWQKEMHNLNEQLNNLDNIKPKKETDAEPTIGRMKAYLKGKGITEIERDVKGKTQRISLAQAKKQEVLDEYTAQKEIFGETEKLEKAKSGVSSVEEIAEATTQQMRKEFGLADIDVAEAKVTEIKESTKDILPASEKDSKQFLDRQELDSSHSLHIEPQSKKTNMIIVDWLNSLSSLKSTQAMHITKFLKESGKKDISEITMQDIKTWVEKKAKNNVRITSELTSMSGILQHANERGFINKLPATRKQMKKWWNIANEQIKIKGKEISEIAGEYSKKHGGVEKSLSSIEKASRTDAETNIVSKLHMQEGFGLRTSEINKLTPKNIKKTPDGYEIELTTYVSKSVARPIPITKETYNSIQKIIKKKGIKEDQVIFDSKIPSKIAEASGIKDLLISKGIQPKLELITRKLVEGIWRVKGLSETGIRIFNNIMGHATWSEKIYGVVATTGQQRKINNLALNVLRGKISGKQFEQKVRDVLGVTTGEQLQVERQTKLKKVKLEEQKQQKEFFIDIAKDKLPDFKIKLNQKLGKKDGERILGSASEYTAKIAEGKVREDTVPHEVAHVFTTVLEASGNTKLLQEGLRAVRFHYKKELAKLSPKERQKQEKEILNQIVGEMATEAMKTEKRWEQISGTKAPLYKKLSRVIKKFWSQMKVSLGMASERDIARLMAEGFVTGKLVPKVEKGAEVSKIEYYQTEGTFNKLQKQIKAIENKHLRLKNITRQEIEDARKFEDFTIPKGKGSWKKGKEDGSLTAEMLDQYKIRLDELTAGRKLVAIKINEVDRQYNVKEQERKLILDKVFGVKDGETINIKNNNLWKSYRRVITAYKNAPSETNTASTLILSGNKEKLAWSTLNKIFVDSFHIIRKHFSEKLAHKLIAHDVSNAEFKGKGDSALHSILKLIGSDVKRLNLYDAEVVARKEKAGTLDKRDRKFISQLQVKNSNERKALAEHKRLFNYYWKQIFTEIKQHLPEISFNEFKRDYGEKYIENYFNRSIRREAVEYLDLKSKHFDKMVNIALRDAALSKAKKELKNKKNVTSSDINKLRDKHLKDKKLKDSVLEQVFDIIHSPQSTSLQNKNLLTRGVMLPEYIEVLKNGKTKKIKVHEDYGVSLESYILSMSKFLSTTRHFPEFTKIGQKYKVPGKEKVRLIESSWGKGRIRELLGYAYQVIMAQIGKDIVQYDPKGRKLASALSSTSAAMGLSSPMAGIKNLFIGIPRAYATFGLKNTIKGVRSLWDASTWDIARKKGILQYGAHTLDLRTKELPLVGVPTYNRQTKRFEYKPISMADIFKNVNLMTHTENINRIVSAHAGTLFFEQTLNRYKGQSTMFNLGGKKDNYRILREVYKLSKEEISWLEKTDTSLPKNSITYKLILEKVMHEAHISTQGGTTAIRLPLWMSRPHLKE